ncbi:MAG TPA: hypothetical protein VLI90_03760, partial [Tepidisphaeraceae bacterium]|nr:hypothetical protein [Tepidisphaeraceae bacterium]
VSSATNSFITQIGGFVGHLSTSDISGPDGVLVVNLPGQHSLYAGDGNSTLKGFNVNAGYAPLPNTPLATGPASDKRVDEMAFNPTGQRLLVVNDAATPSPFISLINTTNNTIAVKTVFNGLNGTPNATMGLEQPVWDPTTQKFYLSMPQNNGTGPGAIAEIDSTTGAVTHVFNLGDFGISSCGPTGLARGTGGRLLIGCGNAGTQSILFNPQANGGNGAIIKTFSQVSGSDQVWYDPTTHRFFITAANNIGGPVLGIVGLDGTFLGDLTTSPGAHSVAVDPVTGEIFVPFGGIAGNTTCPNGCIAVYTPNAAVPEPPTLPLLATFVTLLLGAAWKTGRRTH